MIRGRGIELLNYPVVVLASGQGTRMGRDFNWLSKALLPLEKRPLLRHIFDQFSKSQQFVVTVGHEAQDIIDYFSFFEHRPSATFVEVKNFSGERSGPGTSAASAVELIKGPFYLLCCDGLWKEPFPAAIDENWLGVSPLNNEKEAKNYCLIEAHDSKVTRIVEKDPTRISDLKLAFNGIAFVKDWQLFLLGIQLAHNQEVREVQLSHGFNQIRTEREIRSQLFNSWRDLGTRQLYLNARAKEDDFLNHKSEQLFFLDDGKVIKLMKSEQRCSQLVERANDLAPLTPAGFSRRGRLVGYPFIEGVTLSADLNKKRLLNFLFWCRENLWLPRDVPSGRLSRASDHFYKVETLQRIECLFDHPQIDDVIKEDLIEFRRLWPKVVLDFLSNPLSVRFHGDLQTENVLAFSGGKYVLLDWRNDYGGETAFGDLFYDLAKLQTSLHFDFRQLSSPTISTGLSSRPDYFELKAVLDSFLDQLQISREPLDWIESAILLRMSALHPEPLKSSLARKGLELFFKKKPLSLIMNRSNKKYES